MDLFNFVVITQTWHCCFYQDQQEYPAYFVDFTMFGFLKLEIKRRKAGIHHSKRLFSRIPVSNVNSVNSGFLTIPF